MDQLTRLAREARAGDGRALDALVEASYDQVWRFCAGIVGFQSAEDLAQETFIRAVRALPAFRSESSARTWLLGIARHVCLDEIRARKRRRRYEPASGASADRAAPDDPTGEVAVSDLIARLEPDRRTAFVLTQRLGLSYQEAAEVCQCPVGTIRSRVARARADLLDVSSDQRGRRHGRPSPA